jgi:hypothetical protein
VRSFATKVIRSAEKKSGKCRHVKPKSLKSEITMSKNEISADS